jgi:lipoprotein NlpD
MIGRRRKSFIRIIAVGVIVFALANAESKACDSPKLAARKSAEISENSRTKAHKFLWPAPGRIIVSLCGFRSEGIDLVVADGAPIRAADAGVVAYAGDELKGYGNVIIIRHDDGFVSAYAHVQTVKVKRGDQVSRGQIIAAASRRPDDQPLLHFELRKGGKTVDAERFLERRPAQAGR